MRKDWNQDKTNKANSQIDKTFRKYRLRIKTAMGQDTHTVPHDQVGKLRCLRELDGTCLGLK